MGGIVKANGKANLKVITYVRDARGLLCDRSEELIRLKPTSFDLLPLLREAIANAAREGKPYTKSGINGVYSRRFEMEQLFHSIGKHSFAGMVDTLLAKGDVVQAMADNSKSVKWLDVPSGDIAQGQASFSAGFLQRSTRLDAATNKPAPSPTFTSLPAKPPGASHPVGGIRYGEHRG